MMHSNIKPTIGRCQQYWMCVKDLEIRDVSVFIRYEDFVAVFEQLIRNNHHGRLSVRTTLNGGGLTY